LRWESHYVAQAILETWDSSDSPPLASQVAGTAGPIKFPLKFHLKKRFFLGMERLRQEDCKFEASLGYIEDLVKKIYKGREGEDFTTYWENN
jgi:hypothetical protein